MKRIVSILCTVLFSVGLMSCGFDFWGNEEADSAKNTYYVGVRSQAIVLNKTNKSVRILSKILPPDSMYVLYDRVWEVKGVNPVNPRDSIKKNPYTYLTLGMGDNVFVYGYSEKTQSYDSLLQSWSNMGNRNYSIFNKENWKLAILKDTMYFDKRGNGFPPSTRFQFPSYYAGNYGAFHYAYTYTLTDEALNEE